MKASDKFTLSAAWWKSNKAKTLPDPGLDKALQNYETAAKSVKTRGSIGGYDAVLNAIADVRQKVTEVAKRCKKKLHDETLAVLTAAHVKQVLDTTQRETAAKRKELTETLAGL